MKTSFVILTISFALIGQNILCANPAERLPIDPARSQIRGEKVEFAVSAIHDLQLHTFDGKISFMVENTSYVLDSPAGKDTNKLIASAALLSEIRLATRLSFEMWIPDSTKPVIILTQSLVLHYDKHM